MHIWFTAAIILQQQCGAQEHPTSGKHFIRKVRHWKKHSYAAKLVQHSCAKFVTDKLGWTMQGTLVHRRICQASPQITIRQACQWQTKQRIRQSVLQQILQCTQLFLWRETRASPSLSGLRTYAHQAQNCQGRNLFVVRPCLPLRATVLPEESPKEHPPDNSMPMQNQLPST